MQAELIVVGNTQQKFSSAPKVLYYEASLSVGNVLIAHQDVSFETTDAFFEISSFYLITALKVMLGDCRSGVRCRWQKALRLSFKGELPQGKRVRDGSAEKFRYVETIGELPVVMKEETLNHLRISSEAFIQVFTKGNHLDFKQGEERYNLYC